MGSVHLQLKVAKKVPHQLEMAHDHHSLAPHEDQLWQLLKLKSLALG
jgi:hypothetical protein